MYVTPFSLRNGNDKDERVLNTIYVKEKLSCSSKIKLPSYTVEMFPKYVFIVNHLESVCGALPQMFRIQTKARCTTP